MNTKPDDAPKAPRRAYEVRASALAVFLAAILVGIAAPGEGRAAEALIDCPGTSSLGAQFVSEITIDVGATPLGAYGVTVTYEPAVLTIASVAGGDTAEFSSNPTTNPSTFSSGSTRISGFQNSSASSPTGVVSVAKVTFNVVGEAAAPSPIGLVVRDLFDPNATSIPATAMGCSVSVPPSGTTTTTIAGATTTSTLSTTTSTTTSPPTTTTSTTSTSTTSQPPTTTTSSSTTTTSSTSTTAPPSTTTSTTSASPTTTSSTTTEPPTTSTSTTSTTSTSTTEATSSTTTSTAATSSTTTEPPTTTSTTSSTSTTVPTSSTTTSTTATTSSTTSSTTTVPPTTTSTSTSAPPTTSTTTTMPGTASTTTSTTSSTSTSTTTTTTVPGPSTNSPPDCSFAVAVPDRIWPPNRRLVGVSIEGVMDPDGDALAIAITSVAQDEVVSDQQPANPCGDATGVDTARAMLRAERLKDRRGRIYRVGFEADDGHGGRCAGSVQVCVPRKRKGSCVDQAQSFDSSAAACSGACDDLCGMELAVSALCSGDRLPRTLEKRIEKARVLLTRAAKNTSGVPVTVLVSKALKQLERAGEIAARAQKKGLVSDECVGDLQQILAGTVRQ